jgi:hypothetical protein
MLGRGRFWRRLSRGVGSRGATVGWRWRGGAGLDVEEQKWLVLGQLWTVFG